ncbi:MAG: RHS repeat-associated core domain-containing protein [Planctomycetaceae bacterium]|jgi:RHS repeat-associated protein|nr:RHS repeat-associated core domain-containing protein [Planctomycetaceae bacterium]
MDHHLFDGIGQIKSGKVYTDSLLNYRYDNSNRLVSRTVDQTDNQIVLQFENNELVQRNFWGSEIDELLAVDNLIDDETLWVLADHLNSTRHILRNENNQITNIASINYDAFGNIAEGENPINIAYTGKYYDDITNLQWNINRWYDQKTGQWISEDPLGFGAGDANLYRYVGNNPINMIDPNGLDEFPGEYEHIKPDIRNQNSVEDFLNKMKAEKDDLLKEQKQYNESSKEYKEISKKLQKNKKAQKVIRERSRISHKNPGRLCIGKSHGAESTFKTLGRVIRRIGGVPLTFLEVILTPTTMGDGEIRDIHSPYHYPYEPYNPDQTNLSDNPRDIFDSEQFYNDEFADNDSDEYEWFDNGHCNGGEYRQVQK